MDRCIPIEEIKETVFQLKNPTAEIISKASIRQKEILSNPHHIPHLISHLIEDEMDELSRIYILDLYDTFIKSFQWKLPIKEIIEYTLQIPSNSFESEYSIKKLS